MEKEIITTENSLIDEYAVDASYLDDWYIASVDETDEPRWTSKHINELTHDFKLIPMESADDCEKELFNKGWWNCLESVAEELLYTHIGDEVIKRVMRGAGITVEECDKWFADNNGRDNPHLGTILIDYQCEEGGEESTTANLKS